MINLPLAITHNALQIWKTNPNTLSLDMNSWTLISEVIIWETLSMTSITSVFKSSLISQHTLI